MKTHVELMCLYWTTAGVYPGRGEISPYDFKTGCKQPPKPDLRASESGMPIWSTSFCIERSRK